MSFLARLEPKFGRFAVPNLTAVIIAGQVMMFVANAMPATAGHAPTIDSIRLEPDKIAQGEVWRLVTFVFDPPKTNLIFAFFGWYLFYLMGTTLENVWGTFRYNVFLGIGYLASIAMAFLTWLALGMSGEAASNIYLEGTVFLAFARLYPDFVILVMFILPVKIRWIALLTWIGYGLAFIVADSWLSRVMIFAAVLNYLLFFGREIWQDVKYGHRRMQFRAKTLRGTGRLVHRCRVCGLTSDQAPQIQFRYCSKCNGDCYCPDHIQEHEHTLAAQNETLSA